MAALWCGGRGLTWNLQHSFLPGHGGKSLTGHLGNLPLGPEPRSAPQGVLPAPGTLISLLGVSEPNCPRLSFLSWQTGWLNRLAFANQQPASLLPSVISASFTFCKGKIHPFCAWSGEGAEAGRTLVPLLGEGGGWQEGEEQIDSAWPTRPPLPARSNLLSLGRPRTERLQKLPSRLYCRENFP